MEETEICGKPAPPHWLPAGLMCVLQKGHKIIYDISPKLKKKLVKSGHKTNDGRVWPSGKENLEYI